MKNIYSIIIALIISLNLNAQELNLIPVKHGDLWGAVNSKGEIVLPYTYDRISFYSNDLLLVEKDYKKGLINNKGKEILEMKYQAINPLNDILYRVIKNNLMGLVDAQGNIIFQPEYRSIIYSEIKNEFIVSKNSKYGLFNSRGELLIPVIYDNISFYSKGNYLLKKDRKFALINDYKLHNIAEYYHNITSLGNCFLVQNDDKLGLLDSSLKEIIPPKYHDIKLINNKFFLISKKDKYAIFNNRAKRISRYIFDNEYQLLNENVLWIKSSNEWMRFDFHSKKSKKLRYERVLDPVMGVYRVVEDNYVILLDSNENRILKNNYNDVLPLNDSLFKVKSGRKWGVVNLQEESRIDVLYDDISLTGLEEKVKSDREDILSEIVTKEYNSSFTSLIEVSSNYKKGLYSQRGEKLLDAIYDNIDVNSNSSVVKYNKGSLFGAIRRSGAGIVDAKYKSLQWSELSKIFLAKTDSSLCLISLDKKVKFLENIDAFNWTDLKDKFVITKNYQSALINADLDTLLNFRKGSLYSISSNFLVRSIGEEHFVYTKHLKEVSERAFSKIEIVKSKDQEFLKLSKGSLSGLVNEEGDFVVPVKYHDIKILANKGLIAVYDNNELLGYYDFNGKSYIN